MMFSPRITEEYWVYLCLTQCTQAACNAFVLLPAFCILIYFLGPVPVQYLGAL